MRPFCPGLNVLIKNNRQFYPSHAEAWIYRSYLINTMLDTVILIDMFRYEVIKTPTPGKPFRYWNVESMMTRSIPWMLMSWLVI